MVIRTVKLQKYIDKEDRTWKVIEDPLIKIPEWRIEQLKEWINKYTSSDEPKIRQFHLDDIEKQNKKSIESGECLLVEDDKGFQLLIARRQIQE